jgi:hypothetical protein
MAGIPRGQCETKEDSRATTGFHGTRSRSEPRYARAIQVWADEVDLQECNMLTATVSGSFHRHMGAITEAVNELAALSVRVLSPADPRIVAQQGEFLFVASDQVRSLRLVQDRHLDCVRSGDFLWLVCPDGYVGVSSSLEIGAAITAQVPVFASRLPSDITLREYVTLVPNIRAALKAVSTLPQREHYQGLLIDPNPTIEQAHRILEHLREVLTTRNNPPAGAVYRDISTLKQKLALPTYTQ